MRVVLGILLPVLLLSSPVGALSYSADDLNRLIKNKQPFPNPSPTPVKPADVGPIQTVFHVTKENPVLKITLPFQSGTGYMWFLDATPSALDFVRMDPPVTSDLPGGPGTSTWVFKVKPAAFKTPQKILVEFTYRRIWESNYAKKEVITIFTE